MIVLVLAKVFRRVSAQVELPIGKCFTNILQHFACRCNCWNRNRPCEAHIVAAYFWNIGHVRLTLFSNLKWNAARSSFPAAVPIEASVIRDVSWRFISKCPFMDKCKKPGNVLIHRMGYFRLITKLQHCLQRKRLLDPPAPSFNYSLLIIHIFDITISIITIITITTNIITIIFKKMLRIWIK